MKKRLILMLLGMCALGLVVAASTSKEVRRFVTLYANGSSTALQEIDVDSLSKEDLGAYLFLQGDFGALSTDTLKGSATPWLLTATVLTLQYVDGDRSQLSAENMAAAFRQFGISSPSEVSNWPSHLPQPEFHAPAGIVTGAVSRQFPKFSVTAANFTCAMCHSSVVFDKHGIPDPNRIWIGPPNGSINLEAYPQAIFDGFLEYGGDPQILDSVNTLFRSLSDIERETLKKYVLPRAVERIKELKQTTGRGVPFKGGYPGLTNGFDALQIRLGLRDASVPIDVSAFNSIANLEDRALRTSLLNAANYEIPGASMDSVMRPSDITDAHLDKLGGIVAYFAVPSMGLDLETAGKQVATAQTVMRFVLEYDTPPFPGEVDNVRAATGRQIYTTHCASCHGTYSASPNQPSLVEYPNYVGAMGTDSLRLSLLTQEFAATVNESLMGKYIHAPEPRGYSAPSLSGIWLSAPYLHNGSVPTLWDLMNSDERPTKFPIGGHMLDNEKVGVKLDVDATGIARYPAGYEPWSIPVEFDTRDVGNSNAGHETPFEPLSETEKRALLEYLKTL